MVMEFGYGEAIEGLGLETLFEGGCRLFSSSESSRVLLRQSIAFAFGFGFAGAENKIAR